ncbi:MAG TPA: glycosyltransferase [Anaerolineales bacterium]|nr:glycosyltransferase [Anaerolineales bacterium]
MHYSTPPAIGGVENVILAHIHLLSEAGYSTTVVTGSGAKEALPARVEFVQIPELDSQHPQILEINRELEQGCVPISFDGMVTQLEETLAHILPSIDHVIVHNAFTKHFNVPLTAALFQLLDKGAIRRCIAWCHDFTWTSPHSRSKVHPGFPWDFLRTHRLDVTYVTISQQRQRELAGLFGCAPKGIRVIYNGINPSELLALSDAGAALIDRLGLWDNYLNLLMPVRVTQAKNIELALHVAESLKARGAWPKLVVTGPPDPHDPMSKDYFQSLLALRERLGVVQDVRFVYESGTSSDEPLLVDMPMVGELLRVSDALFMPSHREGFGMPVLEAGLVGMPIFCSDQVPAAKEIGGQDILRFSPTADPDQVADLILKYIEGSSVLRLRRRVRQRLTWRSIFRRKILSLLEGGAA